MTCPDQYLNNCYRFVIVWIGNDIEVHNPLNGALQDKQDPKIAYSINGSWYFNDTNVMENDIDLEIIFSWLSVALMIALVYIIKRLFW